MLWQFFLENVRFALNLLFALSLFAVGWLYFDAWRERKETKEQFRFIGFFLLALSFLLAATQVDSTAIELKLFQQGMRVFIERLVVLSRIIGYLLIIYGLKIDPFQPRPEVKKLDKKAPLTFGSTGAFVSQLALIALAPLAALVGYQYWRRSTVGYERHLKPVAFFFFLLALAEFFSLAVLFRGTTNVDLFNLVAPFGPLWFARYLTLGLSLFVLRGWVFGYLLKRFATQLFMILTASIVVIFLVITFSFTFLLLRNIQVDSLARLEKSAKVLGFAIEAKKGQVLSDAQLLAQNPNLRASLGNRQRLTSQLEDFLVNKEASFLLIANRQGEVLARGEDPESFGDSISGDPLFVAALAGEETTSFSTRAVAFGQEISVAAAVPVKSGDNILGVVIAGALIDNAFVDGLKVATGLEASIYADKTLSATTILAADGKSRPLGIQEQDAQINSRVLEKGEVYAGTSKVLGVNYLGGYLPLKDITDKPVGMVFVGEPEINVLRSAAASIELTFIAAVFLLVLSVAPAYFISKYLTSQI